MNAFQIAFTVIFALQALIAVRRFLGTQHLASLVFAVAWLVAIVLVNAPELTTDAARLLGIGRGVDLVTYALLSLFLWAHYQHYLRYKRLENQLTVLVRELAILNAARPQPGTAPGPQRA